MRWASDLLMKKTTGWIQSSAQCFLIVDDDPVVQWFCIFGYLFVSSHTNFQSVCVNVNLRKFSGHVREWSSLQHRSSNTLLFALMSKSDLRTSLDASELGGVYRCAYCAHLFVQQSCMFQFVQKILPPFHMGGVYTCILPLLWVPRLLPNQHEICPMGTRHWNPLITAEISAFN